MNHGNADDIRCTARCFGNCPAERRRLKSMVTLNRKSARLQTLANNARKSTRTKPRTERTTKKEKAT